MCPSYVRNETDDQHGAQPFNGSKSCRVADGVSGTYIFSLVLAGRFSDDHPSIGRDNASFKATVFAAHSAAGWASGRCLYIQLCSPVTGSVILLEPSPYRASCFRGIGL